MSGNSYSLKFTSKASKDLEQIYSYISGKLFAEIAAGNLLEKIESSIMRLKYYPYSGSFVLDELLKSRGYRKLIICEYLPRAVVRVSTADPCRGRDADGIASWRWHGQVNDSTGHLPHFTSPFTQPNTNA